MSEKCHNRVKYFYFFRGWKTHVHFYRGWVEAAIKNDISMELVTVLPLKEWLESRDLRIQYRSLKYVHILCGFNEILSRLLAILFFFWALLHHDKVVVQLKKYPPYLLDYLKKIFPKKLSYIIEFEGDVEAEKAYLLEHPYKRGFYDDLIRNIEQQVHKRESMLKNSDHVFVVTSFLKELMVQRFPSLGLESKITVISTGVDCEQRFFSEELRKDFRQVLKLEDKFIMIFVGNVYYSWQNLSRTIEIFKLIKEKLAKNAFLILLIRQQDHDIAKEFIEKLVLSPEDYLLTSVPDVEITKYLNAADLGILLRHEHLMNRVAAPGKFGEYVACGLPVMMTRGIAHFSDLIAEGEYGIVLDDMDNDEEVLRKIEPYLIYNKAKRNKISVWAKETVSIESQTDSFVAALRRVAEIDE